LDHRVLLMWLVLQEEVILRWREHRLTNLGKVGLPITSSWRNWI
jgi:hypothetical protein